MIIVMPLLHERTEPPFGAIEEAVECFGQLFEVSSLDPFIYIPHERAGFAIHAQTLSCSPVYSQPRLPFYITLFNKVTCVNIFWVGSYFYVRLSHQ